MRRYLVIALVAALLTFPPLYTYRFVNAQYVGQVRTAASAAATHQVVMYGNSAIRHSSKCDRDRRSVVRVVSEASGVPVLDLSRGGMTVAEMASLNGLVMRLMRPKVVVLPISPDMFDPDGVGYSPTASRPGARLLATVVPDYLMQAAYFAFPADHVSPALEYNGRRFGDYESLKRLFEREKEAQTCPEKDGIDPAFIEFMYWRASRYALGEMDRRMVQALIDEVRSFGAVPLLVRMPVHRPFFARPGATRDAFARALAEQQQFLASTRAPFVDLGDLLTHEDFIDRWCACGHMADTGRIKVGRAIADALRRLPPTSP